MIVTENPFLKFRFLSFLQEFFYFDNFLFFYMHFLQGLFPSIYFPFFPQLFIEDTFFLQFFSPFFKCYNYLFGSSLFLMPSFRELLSVDISFFFFFFIYHFFKNTFFARAFLSFFKCYNYLFGSSLFLILCFFSLLFLVLPRYVHVPLVCLNHSKQLYELFRQIFIRRHFFI